MAAASESPTDFLPGLGQLGLGALIVAPSYAAVWALWRHSLALTSEKDAALAARDETYAKAIAEKDATYSASLASKDATIASLQESRRQDLVSQVGRERDLTSRVIPTLAESAQVIAQAPTLYRQAAEQQSQTADLQRLLADLAGLLPEMRKRAEP